MAHIKGTDRNQEMMFPPRLDDWIPKDHPARIIDMFVESLEIEYVGPIENNQKTGRPSYSPRVMLKILLYGYATGERSSRALEKKTYDDIGYRWLSNDLHPDYRSIARFRQNNGYWMKQLLAETLAMYCELGFEIKGLVFTDGTKMLANANDNNVVSDLRIKRLEEQVNKILEEAENADKEEDDKHGNSNNGYMKEGSLDKLKAKIEVYKAKQKEAGKKTVSLTDKQANFMWHSGSKGIHLSYNAQVTADRNGIIVAADVTEKKADDGELLKENIAQAETNIGKKVKIAVADAGYYETKALLELSEEKRLCLVPKPVRLISDKSKYKYNKENNTYICEKGVTLKWIELKKQKKNLYNVYAAEAKECRACDLLGKCYRGNGLGYYGRKIMVSEHNEFMERNQEQLKKHKYLYDKRKEVIEPIIGTIKVRQRFRGFTLRGLEKVRTEWNLATTSFNLLKIWKISRAIS